MYNSLKFGLSAIALALLAACGGGGSDSSSSADGYTVSGGTVQKGPLVQGSSITVNTLSSTTWQPSGASYTFEITNNLGNFSAASTVFNAQYAESTALGYYFDELKGVVSNDMVYLRGLSDLRGDKSINLNVLTDMVRARIRALTTRTTSPLTFANARLQAQKELLAAFYIYNSADLLPSGTTGPANFNEIDLSKTRNADQILAAISGVITQMGQNGSGINLALSKLEVDLADDGLINNSPNYAASNVTRLSSAETATNFTAVANNLNAFYGNANFTGTSVGQWIDSSGGVDRVIDKNKFSTYAPTLNVESLSPFYSVGSDDVGQCVSVTAGKLYRKVSGAASATLVNTATLKVATGDQYQIGLTPTIAAPASAFMQRSAPVSGVCPSTLPTTGLTRIAKYSVSYGVITLAGSGAAGYAGGLGTQAVFNAPTNVAVDSGGNLYVVDGLNNVIRKITPAGLVSTFAGSGVEGNADGTGIAASFRFHSNYEGGPPYGAVAIDPTTGNLYVADTFNYVIRKITPAGVVSTVAGSGVAGAADANGLAASFNHPAGIAFDSKSGKLYVSDTTNCLIRVITPLLDVYTLAGSARSFANGTGAAAMFNLPLGIVVDPNTGNIYVADIWNNMIRMVTPTGVVTTLAGTGAFGNSDGDASTASFYYPEGLAVDASGNVFVGDGWNYKIRKISPTGQVSTLAGTGAAGGADGPSASATFNFAQGLAVDSAGYIYVADVNNNKIRKISPP